MNKVDSPRTEDPKMTKAEIRAREAAMSECLAKLETDLKEIDEGEYWKKRIRDEVMSEIRWDIAYILRAREIKTVEAFLDEVSEVTEYLDNYSESIRWDREYLEKTKDIQRLPTLNPLGVLTQGNIDSIGSKLTTLSNMQKKRVKVVQYLIDQGNKLFSRLDANSDGIEELKKGIEELESLRAKYIKDDAFVENLSSEFDRACAILNRRGADRVSPYYGGVAEEELQATMRHYMAWLDLLKLLDNEGDPTIETKVGTLATSQATKAMESCSNPKILGTTTRRYIKIKVGEERLQWDNIVKETSAQCKTLKDSGCCS